MRFCFSHARNWNFFFAGTAGNAFSTALARDLL
jgi:hypothetical protein